jgi:hypothetical protein
MFLRVAIQSDDVDLGASIAEDLNLHNSSLATDWTKMLTVMVAFAKVGNITAVQDILEKLASTGSLPTEPEEIVPFHQVCRSLVEKMDPALLLTHMESWFDKYGIVVIGPSTFDRILHKMISNSPSIDYFADVARLLRLDHRQTHPVGIRPHTILQVFRGLVTAERRFSSSSFELFKLVHSSNPQLVSKELCILLQNMSTQDARWRDMNELEWQSRLFESGFGNPEARIIVPFKANLRSQILEEVRACSLSIKDTRLTWHDSDMAAKRAADAGFSMRLRCKPEQSLSLESTKVQMELLMVNKQRREVTRLFHSLLDRGLRPTERIVWLATQAKLDGNDVAGALRLHAQAEKSGWPAGSARYAILEHMLRSDPDPVRGALRRVQEWTALPDVAPAHKRALVAHAALRYLRSPLARGRAALDALDAYCASGELARLAPPGAEIYKAYLAAHANVFDWAGIDWAVGRLVALGEPLGADVLLLAARLRREMCKELLVLTAGGCRGPGGRRRARPVNACAREYLRGSADAGAGAAEAPEAAAEGGEASFRQRQPDVVRGAWEMWKQRERALAAAAAPAQRRDRAVRAERLLRALLMHGDGAGPVVRLVGKPALTGWRRGWARRVRRVGAEARRRSGAARECAAAESGGEESGPAPWCLRGVLPAKGQDDY